MRLNESMVLLGPRVRLVPYRRAHVLRYNQWMQDPELLELTCSEPLTLEQEFQNQRSWHADPLKLTFILCARDDDDGGAIPDDLTSGMCGDVNAFLSEIAAASARRYPAAARSRAASGENAQWRGRRGG